MTTYYELLGNEVNDLYLVRRTLLRIICDLEVISGFVDSGDIQCCDLFFSSNFTNCIQTINNCCDLLHSIIDDIGLSSSLLADLEKSILKCH